MATSTKHTRFPKTPMVRLAETNWIDPLLKQRLQELCIEKARLSLLICEIQHTLNDGSLIMANDASSNLKIWELHTKLEAWYLALPTELLTGGATTQGAGSDTNRVLFLNTSVVVMTYCMAMTALHKSSFADSGCRESPDAEIVSSGHCDVENEKAHANATRIAASRIMETLQILQERDLTKYVLVIGVAVVCATASVFLLDARSTQTTIRQWSLDHLDTCAHTLRTRDAEFHCSRHGKDCRVGCSCCSKEAEKSRSRGREYLKVRHGIDISEPSSRIWEDTN